MIVQLPGGYYDTAGTRHREVELSPLSGRDEELLAARTRAPAELVTGVLARCLRRVGTLAPVDEAIARELTVGDRQYLLLKLREATFGPRVALVTSCSWPDCGEKVDIDFEIPQVPLREATSGPVYEVELSAAALPAASAEARLVRFRLPTGADQEHCTPLLEVNPAAALHALLSACLVQVGAQQPPSPERIAELSPLARAEIDAAMTARSTGPALTMRARCPGCGRGFTVPLDLQELFFDEAAASRDLLYRQVHYLAFHYHWGERDILDMPRAKRLHYVELLAAEIERMNDELG